MSAASVPTKDSNPSNAAGPPTASYGQQTASGSSSGAPRAATAPAAAPKSKSTQPPLAKYASSTSRVAGKPNYSPAPPKSAYGSTSSSSKAPLMKPPVSNYAPPPASASNSNPAPLKRRKVDAPTSTTPIKTGKPVAMYTPPAAGSMSRTAPPTSSYRSPYSSTAMHKKSGGRPGFGVSPGAMPSARWPAAPPSKGVGSSKFTTPPRAPYGGSYTTPTPNRAGSYSGARSGSSGPKSSARTYASSKPKSRGSSPAPYYGRKNAAAAPGSSRTYMTPPNSRPPTGAASAGFSPHPYPGHGGASSSPYATSKASGSSKKSPTRSTSKSKSSKRNSRGTSKTKGRGKSKKNSSGSSTADTKMHSASTALGSGPGGGYGHSGPGFSVSLSPPGANSSYTASPSTPHKSKKRKMSTQSSSYNRPHSPSASPSPPSSSGQKVKKKGGSSCHQCKSRRNFSALTYCTGNLDRKNKNCRKKFCEHCLKKFYKEDPNDVKDRNLWKCPSCRKICCCAACRRRKTREAGSSSSSQTNTPTSSSKKHKSSSSEMKSKSRAMGVDYGAGANSTMTVNSAMPNNAALVRLSGSEFSGFKGDNSKLYIAPFSDHQDGRSYSADTSGLAGLGDPDEKDPHAIPQIRRAHSAPISHHRREMHPHHHAEIRRPRPETPPFDPSQTLSVLPAAFPPVADFPGFGARRSSSDDAGARSPRSSPESNMSGSPHIIFTASPSTYAMLMSGPNGKFFPSPRLGSQEYHHSHSPSTSPNPYVGAAFEGLPPQLLHLGASAAANLLPDKDGSAAWQLMTSGIDMDVHAALHLHLLSSGSEYDSDESSGSSSGSDGDDEVLQAQLSAHKDKVSSMLSVSQDPAISKHIKYILGRRDITKAQKVDAIATLLRQCS
jgi:Zinc-finger domain of monoamine-oxidase A repressor R1